MTCPNASKLTVENLVDYCAGTLSESASAAVKAHVTECKACDELVKAQQSAWSLLDEWLAPAVADDFDARLYRRIELEKQESWPRRFWNSIRNPDFSLIWRPAIPVAAAAVALAVGLSLRTPSTPVLTSSVQPMGTSIETVTTSAAQSVDVDKLESALDDLDMLTPMSKGGMI